MPSMKHASPEAGRITVYRIRSVVELAGAIRPEQPGDTPIRRAQAHVAHGFDDAQTALEMLVTSIKA